MREFLEVVWGDLRPPNDDPLARLYGEIRTIYYDHVQQRFVTSVREAIEGGIDPMVDVYYGVLPRIRGSGKAEDCVRDVHVLWADLDAKHFDGGKGAALIALGRANLTPSILVDSGNGLHPYWLLREPQPFALVQPLMQGLQKAIGSDAVHDAPRILRLPGTYNHKTTPANPVRLLHFEPSRRYRLSDFDLFAPDEPRPLTRDFERREAVPMFDLPVWLKNLIYDGAPRGERSEEIFRAVMWLHRYGWDKAKIRLLIEHEAIGEKLREMSPAAANRWFDRTYDRATQERE